MAIGTRVVTVACCRERPYTAGEPAARSALSRQRTVSAACSMRRYMVAVPDGEAIVIGLNLAAGASTVPSLVTRLWPAGGRR